MSPDPIDPAAWLVESGWVHRLARRLAGADAEDLAQEALLAAWHRPPGAGTPRRVWLIGILRNLVRGRRRDERRRRDRERRHGLTRAPEVGTDAAAIAERLEVHEHMIAAIRKLPAATRTIVVLRFLHELPVHEIAAQTGVPIKTVYSRLDRALNELRRRLDHTFGSRAVWCAPILAWPHPAIPSSAATPATLTESALLPAMRTSTKWIVAAALTTGLGFAALCGWAAPGRAPTPERVAHVGTTTTSRQASLVPIGPPPDRQAVPAHTALVATEPRVSPEAPGLHGFVLDLEQRPVAGIPVRYEPIGVDDADPVLSGHARTAPVVSGPDGAFTLPPYEAACRLAANDEEHATFFAPHLVGPLPPEPQFVFVGPIRRHAGTVVDEAGAVVAGASVAVRLAPQLARRLPGAFLAGQLPIAQVTTDENGHFALPPIGAAPGHTLLVRANGFVETSADLPDTSADDLRVTLVRPPVGAAEWRGRVVLPDGRGAAGAYVAADDVVVACDPGGSFVITPDSGATPRRLVAVHRDHLPVWREIADVPSPERGDLRLVLAERSRTIRGRVIDPDGRPVAGARVWTTDGETFGRVPVRFGEVSIVLERSIETMIAGDDSGRDTLTDPNGRFELRGLLDRDYRVFATVPGSMELLGPQHVRAGRDDMQFVAAGGSPRSDVAGRVTSLAGAAIPDAFVQAERSVTLADGTRLELTSKADQAMRTDADGRFRFVGLCTEGTRLIVKQGSGQLEVTVVLADRANLGDVEIALPQRCHLRVELSDPSSADSLSVLDADGTALSLQFEHGGVLFEANSVSFDLGGTELLIVLEHGRTVVLHKGLDVVARLPLHLVPGEVTRIRW